MLYEELDEERITELKSSDDPDVAGLAGKIDREEAYHRMHAQMWRDRLSGDSRFRAALEEPLRQRLAERTELEPATVAGERGEIGDDLRELWEEMTMVRRSVAGATW